MSSRTGPEEGLREARAPRLSPGVAASSRCSLGGRSIPTLIHSVRGERHGSRREGNAKQCRQDGHEKRRGPPSWSLLVSRLLLFLRGQLVDPLFVHHRACQTVALEYCLLVVPYAAQPAAGSHRRRQRPVGVSAPSGASESGSTGDSGGKLREVCGARAQGVDARQTETAVLPRDSINQQTSPHQHPGGRRGATPTTLRLLFHNTGTRTWVVYVGIAVLSLPGVLFGSWPNGGLLPSFRGSFSSSEAPGDEAAASSLTLVAAVLVLYTTVGAVLVGLCLAASAAAISAPFALGAWGRQLVLRRWRKVASLLVLQQKYMREVIR
ncbi:hypothetical protein BESB_083930 [Besnoitia besnoiti]|uniref:Transmembrane protein n=1 Tax=Besnoitia besnoiti TaxID=94643 RepID=A0A2A9M7N9_BESBE|nr:hypothetical protein BESB_083930 [Besnoitia besnoiti]PFH33194.1 hypothetical protein BESB_083930 [Besnoitia besnoiti]